MTEPELEQDARMLIDSAKHVEPTSRDDTLSWKLISQPALARADVAKTFITADCTADDAGARPPGILYLDLLIRRLRRIQSLTASSGALKSGLTPRS